MKDKNYYINEKIGDSGIAKTQNPLYLSNDYNPFETTPININVGEHFSNDSKYDETLGNVEEAIESGLNVDDLRAQQQSGWDMMGNALVNNIVIAGTSAISGTLGIVDGLLSAVSESDASKFWDNDTNNWAVDTQDVTREAFPIYRGNDYQNKSLGSKMGTGIFWADLFENLGFTEGMLIPGMGMGTLLQGAGKVAKMVLPSLVSAIGEGSVEAVNKRNEEIKDKTDLAYAKYNELAKGAYSELALNVLDNDFREDINDIYEDATKAGNFTLGANIALLTLTNTIEFGNLFNRGFNTSKRLKNSYTRLGSGIKRTSDGFYEGMSMPIELTKTAGKKLLDATSEGFEEVSQSVIARTPTLTEDYNQFNKSQFNPEKRELASNLLQGMGLAISDAMHDPQTAEEFAAGFITGVIGVPTLRKSTMPIKLENNIAGELWETKKKVQKNNETVDKLNARLRGDKGVNAYYNGLVRHLALQDDMNDALDREDNFDYKTAESAAFISDIMMFDEAGDIERLEQLINDSVDMSDEGIKAIIDETTKDGQGPFVVDGNPMSIEDTRHAIQEKIDSLNRKLAGYVNDKKSLETNYALGEESLKNALFLKGQIRDYVHRRDSLLDESFNDYNNLLKSLLNIEENYKELSDVSTAQEFHKRLLTDKKFRDVLLKAVNDESSSLSHDERKAIIDKIDDIGKLDESIFKYNVNLKEVLSNPAKSEEQARKNTEEAIVKDADKKLASIAERFDFSKSDKDIAWTIAENLDDINANGGIKALSSILTKSSKEKLYRANRMLAVFNSQKKRLDALSDDKITIKSTELINAAAEGAETPEEFKKNLEGMATEDLDGFLDYEEPKEGGVASAEDVNAVDLMESKLRGVLADSKQLDKELSALDEMDKLEQVKTDKELEEATKHLPKEDSDDGDITQEEIDAVDRAEEENQKEADKVGKDAPEEKSEDIDMSEVPSEDSSDDDLKNSLEEDKELGNDVSHNTTKQEVFDQSKEDLSREDIDRGVTRNAQNEHIQDIVKGKEDSKDLDRRPQLSEMYLHHFDSITYLDYLDKYPDKYPVGNPKDSKEVLEEKRAAFRKYVEATVQYLKDHNAFDYVKGIDKNHRLNVNDKVYFTIDPKLNEAAGTVVVLMYTMDGDNRQIIGSIKTELDFNSYTIANNGTRTETTYKDANKAQYELFDTIRKEYEEYLKSVEGQEEENKSKYSKDGVIKVCPVCGKPLKGHEHKCPQCDSDLDIFRQIEQLTEEEAKDINRKFFEPLSLDNFDDRIYITVTSTGLHAVNSMKDWSKAAKDMRHMNTGWYEENGLTYYIEQSKTGRVGDNTTIWFRTAPDVQQKKAVEEWLANSNKIDKQEFINAFNKKEAPKKVTVKDVAISKDVVSIEYDEDDLVPIITVKTDLVPEGKAKIYRYPGATKWEIEFTSGAGIKDSPTSLGMSEEDKNNFVRKYLSKEYIDLFKSDKASNLIKGDDPYAPRWDVLEKYLEDNFGITKGNKIITQPSSTLQDQQSQEEYDEVEKASIKRAIEERTKGLQYGITGDKVKKLSDDELNFSGFSDDSTLVKLTKDEIKEGIQALSKEDKKEQRKALQTLFNKVANRVLKEIENSDYSSIKDNTTKAIRERQGIHMSSSKSQKKKVEPFKSSIETEVQALMGGDIDFTSEETTVSSVFGNDAPMLAIATNEGLDTATNANNDIIPPVSMIAGQVYTLIPSNRGSLLPALCYGTKLSELSEDDEYMQAIYKAIIDIANTSSITPMKDRIRTLKSLIGIKGMYAKTGFLDLSDPKKSNGILRVKGLNEKYPGADTIRVYKLIESGKYKGKPGTMFDIPIKDNFTIEDAKEAWNNFIEGSWNVDWYNSATINVDKSRLKDANYRKMVSKYLHFNVSKEGKHSVNDWFIYKKTNIENQVDNADKKVSNTSATETSGKDTEKNTVTEGKEYTVTNNSTVENEEGEIVEGEEKKKVLENSSIKVNSFEEIPIDRDSKGGISFAFMGVTKSTAGKVKDNNTGRGQMGRRQRRPRNLTSEYTNEEASSQRELEMSIEYIERLFPELAASGRINTIVKNMEKTNKLGNPIQVYGSYRDGVINIYNNAPRGTVYHEAFHYVMDMLLSPTERILIFKAARDKYGDLSHMELEERMSEDFRYFMNNYTDPSLIGRIKNIFRELKYMIKNFFNKADYIDNIFYKIYKNKYQNKESSYNDTYKDKLREYNKEKLSYNNLDSSTKEYLRLRKIDEKVYNKYPDDIKEITLQCM